MHRQPDAWHVIETLAATPATRFEWRWRLGALFQPVSKFLRGGHAPDELHVPCTACSSYVRAVPTGPPGEHIAHHDFDSTCRHVATISPNDSAVLHFDARLFANTLRPLLGLDVPSHDDTRATPSLVGHLANPQCVPAYTLLYLDFHAAQSHVENELAAAPRPALILTPKPNNRLKQSLSREALCVLDLSTYLTWTTDGLAKTDASFTAHAHVALTRTAPEAFLAPAFARVETKLDVLATEHTTLRVENEQLKQTAAVAFAGIAKIVSPDDLRIFGAVLAHGTVAAASRAITMKDSTIRSIVEQWPKRGPAYRLMYDLVDWRKKVGGKYTTTFDESWMTEPSRADTAIPDILSDLLSALQNQNASNWQRVRAELLELIREERGS